MNIRCQVIAPSLIPQSPGDRVKTDKRDCRQLPPAHPADRVGLGLPARLRVGVELRRRQAGAPPETVARAWAAPARLCGRFRRLAQKKTSKNVVATAIARELCGFLWAEMRPEMNRSLPSLVFLIGRG